jgi:recombinational DNA repair protein RecR
MEKKAEQHHAEARLTVFKIRYHVLDEKKDKEGHTLSRSTSSEITEIIAARSQHEAIAALPKPAVGDNVILHIGTEIQNVVLAGATASEHPAHYSRPEAAEEEHPRHR